MNDKMIRVNPDIIERLHELKDFIILHGTDYIKKEFEYEIKSLSFSCLIEFLLDIADII